MFDSARRERLRAATDEATGSPIRILGELATELRLLLERQRTLPGEGSEATVPILAAVRILAKFGPDKERQAAVEAAVTYWWRQIGASDDPDAEAYFPEDVYAHRQSLGHSVQPVTHEDRVDFVNEYVMPGVPGRYRKDLLFWADALRRADITPGVPRLATSDYVAAIEDPENADLDLDAANALTAQWGLTYKVEDLFRRIPRLRQALGYLRRMAGPRWREFKEFWVGGPDELREPRPHPWSWRARSWRGQRVHGVRDDFLYWFEREANEDAHNALLYVNGVVTVGAGYQAPETFILESLLSAIS